MSTTDPGTLLGFVETISRSTGLWLREQRSAIGRPTAETKSTGTDMVTAFDRAAEERLVELIHREYPDDDIVGEEGTATGRPDRASGHPAPAGRTWYLDPIDGTTNFLYDLPGWAVSVGVSDANGPLVGAVFVPAADELFSARRGHGAHLRRPGVGGVIGEPIEARAVIPLRCSETSMLAHALVATGFAYSAPRREAHAAHVARFIGEVRDIRRFGAASVDLCHVACGRVDAYIEGGLGPWDIAAGALIASEAGCVLSDFSGGPWGTSEMFVAAPGIAGPLLNLLANTANATTPGIM